MVDHPNAFIRKSALIATAELLRALPAPTVAGAMLRAGSSDADSALSERLQALQGRLRQEHESASDASIRYVATSIPIRPELNCPCLLRL